MPRVTEISLYIDDDLYAVIRECAVVADCDIDQAASVITHLALRHYVNKAKAEQAPAVSMEHAP